MSSPSEKSGSLLSYAWNPAGAVYLVICLISLAVGFWSDVILPRVTPGASPLLAMQSLGVGQVFFFLLVYPVILFSRSSRGQNPWRIFPGCIIECLTMLLVSGPVLFVAAFLSNAEFQDVTRLITLELSLLPLSWACGMWLTRARARTAVMLAMGVFVLALPVVYYICYDFLPGMDAKWLWDIAPVTLVWQNASARNASWLARPIWAQLVMLTAAAGAMTGYRVFNTTTPLKTSQLT